MAKTKQNTDYDPTEDELKIILSEIKAQQKGIGRPVKIDVESLKVFWFWYKQSTMIEWSLEQAKISPQTFRTLKNSKTFQRLLTLREEDLKAVSFINISRSVRGTPATKRLEPVWDKTAGPDGKGDRVLKEVEYPAIPGDIEDSKWLLTIKYGVGKDLNKQDEVPLVGAPRTEEEAELMAKMLNYVYDYRSKQPTDTSGDGTGKTSKSKRAITDNSRDSE